MSNVRRETINEVNRLTIIFTIVFWNWDWDGQNNPKTDLNGTNFPICNKRKVFVLNTFEYGEQYKKKSGNNTSIYNILLILKRNLF